jgi:heme exporter protein C
VIRLSEKSIFGLKFLFVLFFGFVIYGTIFLAQEASGFVTTSRIIFYHVPMAWVAVFAFLVSAVYSILYLRTNNLKFDMIAMSSAQLALLFSFAATITGSIWAKMEWGSFWNWDPRETSILILLLIYAAYFSLRSAIEEEEKRAKLSAVYSILAFVTVPFLIFVVPRVIETLHPENPVFETNPSKKMTSSIKWIFFASNFAFSVVYLWMLKLKIDLEKVKQKVQLIEDNK